MSIQIRNLQSPDRARWDSYVLGHPQATPYHLSDWQRVIEVSYGHNSHYLLAERQQQVVGVLPLVHMQHRLSGNRLISMPFLDMAGALADDKAIADGLIDAARQIMRRVGASALELRQRNGLAAAQSPLITPAQETPLGQAPGQRLLMLRDLPAGADALMQSFRAKLRSQIRKPLALGLETRIGGEEYLDDFYRVFAVNMRDLGSPVHSRTFLDNILERFADQTRIFMVYRAAEPVAAGLLFLFQERAYNPWAASLRKHRDSCPNMLLYWSMLEYACDLGCTQFDFGRSLAGEGTYRFKQQWGAQPVRLCWTTYPNPEVARAGTPATTGNAGYRMAAQIWARLPVPVSRMLGPMIRKHIGL